MNKYKQFTVFVSDDHSFQPEDKMDWAETAHKIKHSNKLPLIFAIFAIFSGLILMLSRVSTDEIWQAQTLGVLAWVLSGYVSLAYSLKNIEPFEAPAENEGALSHPNDIISALLNLGIEVKCTQDLFQVLELSEVKLFNDIRDYTLATLRPKRNQDVKQVNRFFDTIQYCVQNNQKTLPDDIKLFIEIEGRSYPETSGAYINKLKGRKYKSANLYLEWLSN